MKKTIGDYAKSFWDEYIAPTKPMVVDAKKNKFLPRNFDKELKQQGYSKLSPKRRSEIYSESPLLAKGIKKKSLDTFRAWFLLESINDSKPISQDLELLREFETRSNYKYKLYEAKESAHVYGNGFVLITFQNDEDTKIQDPPAPGSIPWDATILNAEYISELKFFNNYYEKKGILHYYYNDGRGKEMYIHPDRIQHVPANKIPGHKLGISTIDLLRYTMFSKKNVDIAAGHILAWFSHGFLDIAVADMEPDEQETYEKQANTHPGAWIHDQDMTIDVKNPQAINPKPFYDFIVLNIAAALNMPTHVLTGVQTGRVTGSEIGFSDYYRDVRDEQVLIFTPLIEKLYSRILTAHGRKWKYKIVWNPIYIDEMSEANLLNIKMTAAKTGLEGNFIDTEEARGIMNKGQIEVDTTKKIAPRPMPQRPDIGEREPVPPKKRGEDKDVSDKSK